MTKKTLDSAKLSKDQFQPATPRAQHPELEDSSERSAAMSEPASFDTGDGAIVDAEEGDVVILGEHGDVTIIKEEAYNEHYSDTPPKVELTELAPERSKPTDLVTKKHTSSDTISRDMMSEAVLNAARKNKVAFAQLAILTSFQQVNSVSNAYEADGVFGNGMRTRFIDVGLIKASQQSHSASNIIARNPAFGSVIDQLMQAPIFDDIKDIGYSEPLSLEQVALLKLSRAYSDLDIEGADWSESLAKHQSHIKKSLAEPEAKPKLTTKLSGISFRGTASRPKPAAKAILRNSKALRIRKRLGDVAVEKVKEHIGGDEARRLRSHLGSQDSFWAKLKSNRLVNLVTLGSVGLAAMGDVNNVVYFIQNVADFTDMARTTLPDLIDLSRAWLQENFTLDPMSFNSQAPESPFQQIRSEGLSDHLREQIERLQTEGGEMKESIGRGDVDRLLEPLRDTGLDNPESSEGNSDTPRVMMRESGP